MRRMAGSIALSSVIVFALSDCGRNGPLTPWPDFDLGQPPSTVNLLPAAGDLGAPPDLAPPPVRRWEWVGPNVTGNPLRAIGGTGANDLWLVGDLGTILHWDGQRASVAHESAANDSFYAVAATAPNDVWIAGSAGSGSILHWDGASWSSAFVIADHTIHALTAGATNVYAAVDPAQIWSYYPGSGWILDYDPIFLGETSVLRDVAAFTDSTAIDTLFTVGDGGLVMWRQGYDWTKGMPNAVGGAADPFSTDKNYFGVWGASKDDVWATFLSSAQIGFTHWDGQTWTVKQTLTMNCNNTTGIVAPIDRGKRLVGLDSAHILANAGPPYYCSSYEWNGATWAPLDEHNAQPNNPSFAAAGGRWYAATSDGQLEVSNSDSSWTPLPQASNRDELIGLSVSDSGIWAANNYTDAIPLRWNGTGWEMPAPIVHNSGQLEIIDVSALGDNDVWLAGVIDAQGVVLHEDGKTWSDPVALPGMDRMTGIWAISDEDVWAVGGGAPDDGWDADSFRAFHFDGASWTDVPVPPHPMYVNSPAVFALNPSSVWFTTHIWDTGHRYVWKWDGSSIQQVAYMPENEVQSFGRPWAASENDVWIPAQPVIHWDGTAWSAIASPPDLDITAIYGTSPNDVWGVGSGPFGGAIWHYENGAFVDAFDTASALYSISGSRNVLPWVVGANGATLRLVDETR